MTQDVQPQHHHEEEEKADYLNVFLGLAGTLVVVGLGIAAAYFLAQALH